MLAELRKGERAVPAVRDWFDSLEDEQIFLSVLTLGEIRRGIELLRRRDRRAAASLDRWLNGLAEHFGDRILGIDEAVVQEWARLSGPDPLPVIDGLLAATATTAGLTLATRNVADIESTGVAWFNPFDPAQPKPREKESLSAEVLARRAEERY